MKAYLLGLVVLASTPAWGQVLYTPGGSLGTSSNGFVGVGTATPSATLDVAGSLRVSSDVIAGSRVGVTASSSEGGSLRISNPLKTSAGQTIDWIIWNMTGGYGNGLKFWRYDGDGSNAGASLTLWDNGDATLIGSLDLSSNLTLGGKLGISTNSPRSRLDLGTTVGAGQALRIGDYFEVGERELYDNAVSIGFNAHMAADNGTYAPTFANGTGLVMAMTGGGFGDLDFLGHDWAGSSTPVGLSAFTSILHLSVNGNVGVGTANPTHRLSVNGTIRAKEVIVDTGWSDYVFAKDYKLAPLEAVKAQIDAEGHLPGVPSAADVARKGISVGEIQATLLAKIEELTLHVIAQQEELSRQGKRIVTLEEQNRALLERIHP